jgi:TspO/MBR family
LKENSLNNLLAESTLSDRETDRSRLARGFLVFFSLSLFFYVVSAFVTYPVIDGWFADLLKPSWNPPNEWFGPVWGVLFWLSQQFLSFGEPWASMF